VPIDSRHFKNIRKAVFWVSFAGPAANLVLVIISAFFLGTLYARVSTDFYFFAPLEQLLIQSVLINLMLAIFNLLPLPPLDGSKMVSCFLSYEMIRRYEILSQYSFMIFLVLIFTGALNYIFYPGRVVGMALINFFYRVMV